VAREYGLYHNDHGAMRNIQNFKNILSPVLIHLLPPHVSCLTCDLRPQYDASPCLAGSNSLVFLESDQLTKQTQQCKLVALSETNLLLHFERE